MKSNMFPRTSKVDNMSGRVENDWWLLAEWAAMHITKMRWSSACAKNSLAGNPQQTPVQCWIPYKILNKIKGFDINHPFSRGNGTQELKEYNHQLIIGILYEPLLTTKWLLIHHQSSTIGWSAISFGALVRAGYTGQWNKPSNCRETAQLLRGRKVMNLTTFVICTCVVYKYTQPLLIRTKHTELY